MESNKKVAAIIVTFNRLSLLQECIHALQMQTVPVNAIIVINNSSTDGTEEWLRTQPDIITITQANKGGAFGFATGIKTGFENGYEWIWCMDDDGRPAPDALEKLIAFESKKPCVLNALVLDKDNPENIVFKAAQYSSYSQIKEPLIINAASFFNATLLHYDVVKKVGLPLKDLTIWGDETEYYNRITFKNKFPIYTVAASHHFHPAQYQVFYKKEWDVNTDWKIFFYIRNKSFAFASRYQSSLISFLKYIFFLIAFAGTIIVYQKKKKWAKFRLLKVAGLDGVRKDSSKGIAEVKSIIKDL